MTVKKCRVAEKWFLTVLKCSCFIKAEIPGALWLHTAVATFSTPTEMKPHFFL